MTEGKTEEKRAEGVRGFVQGSRQCKHLEHMSFVLWGKGHCTLGRECPECIEGKLRIEPKRLFFHLAARILKHRQAHRLGHGRI